MVRPKTGSHCEAACCDMAQRHDMGKSRQGFHHHAFLLWGKQCFQKSLLDLHYFRRTLETPRRGLPVPRVPPLPPALRTT